MELITFHRDYTLIALHFYLIDNPNSPFSKILGALNLDKKIQSIWNEKVQLGLIPKDKKIGRDTSSLNGHILKPGKINEPLSIIWPAFVFLFGPFPLWVILALRLELRHWSRRCGGLFMPS